MKTQNNKELIEKLKERGYQVHVEHNRDFVGCVRLKVNDAVLREQGLERLSKNTYRTTQPLILKPVSRGAVTTVTLEKDGERYVGRCVCSKKDSFSRKDGTFRALCRAIRNTGLSKEERRELIYN